MDHHCTKSRYLLSEGGLKVDRNNILRVFYCFRRTEGIPFCPIVRLAGYIVDMYLRGRGPVYGDESVGQPVEEIDPQNAPEEQGLNNETES